MKPHPDCPKCHAENRYTEIELPWGDAKQWKPGEWFPLPVGFFARNQKEYIVEGYDIFEVDPNNGNETGDIIPACRETGIPTTVFSVALAICEEHNGRKMLK